MDALSIARKDLQILFKDRSAVMQLLVVPLVFIVVFSGALGQIGKSTEEKDTRIPLAVVNLDSGNAAHQNAAYQNAAQALLAGIEAAGGVRTELYDQAQAQQLLEDKKIERVLTIPADFSTGLAAGQAVALRLVSGPDASDQQTEAVRLVVDGAAMDLALERQILLSLEQMGAMQGNSPPEFQQAFSFERTQAQARSQFKSANEQPLIAIKQTVPSAGENQEEQPFNFALVAVPGVAVLFVFLTAQATASSIFEEKKIGSFRRLLASPVSKAALLAGKLIPNFLVALVQIAVIFTFGTLGLRLLGLEPVPLGSSLPVLALVLVVIALCSSALGIVIASLAHTEGQIGGISTLLLWGLGLLGGSLIPLFLMERFLGPLPKIIPHYWANRALENVMIRDLGMAGASTEVLVLLGFTALFFFIGLWRFEYD